MDVDTDIVQKENGFGVHEMLEGSIIDDAKSLDEEIKEELVKIDSFRCKVPVDICENYGIFSEVFSFEMWNDLSAESREHLKVSNIYTYVKLFVEFVLGFVKLKKYMIQARKPYWHRI